MSCHKLEIFAGVLLGCLIGICGCSGSSTPTADGTKFNSDAISQFKPGGKTVEVKPKTTDEIGEFNQEDGKQVVDSKVKISNPITGALEAYQPLKEQIAGLGIDHAVNLFQATEGRYPKDHDEFMTRVVKENQIRLPTLGPGKSYEYDVAHHKLVIVTDAAPAVQP